MLVEHHSERVAIQSRFLPFLPFAFYCLASLQTILNVYHLYHMHMSYFSNLWCGTLSKSKYTTSTAFSLSTKSHTSSKNSSRFVRHDLPLVKPCWLLQITLFLSKKLWHALLDHSFHYLTCNRSKTHWSVVTRWASSASFFKQGNYNRILPVPW